MQDLILEIWPDHEPIETLLDLGCGDLWFTVNLPGVKRHVGIDIWPNAIEKALEKAKGHLVKCFEPYCMDLKEYVRLQPLDSFDCVVAIDVIEHLTEDEAAFLLTQMERVASKLIIVWTTLGYIEQGPFDNNGEPNPYQEHVWGPTAETFGEGWKVTEHPEWHGARGGGIFAYKVI